MLLDGGLLGIGVVVVVVMRLGCSFLGGLRVFYCCCRILMMMNLRFLRLSRTHIRIQTRVVPCESSEKNRFLGAVVLLD